MYASNPLISVVIPVYNGRSFLTAAVTNVLAQAYPPLEIIIIDDGSTDDTAVVAAKLFDPSIRYVHQANAGPAAARNTGIHLAKGAYIAFLDVDDLWSPNKLTTQIAAFQHDPALDLVQGLIQEQTLSTDRGNGRFTTTTPPYHFINIGSVLFKKCVFERVGLFDEKLQFNEDVDWFVRAWDCRINKLVQDQVTLFYRKHGRNMTTHPQSRQLGFMRVLKKHMAHQRQQPQPSDNSFPSLVAYLGLPPINQPIPGATT